MTVITHALKKIHLIQSKTTRGKEGYLNKSESFFPLQTVFPTETKIVKCFTWSERHALQKSPDGYSCPYQKADCAVLSMFGRKELETTLSPSPFEFLGI